MEQRFQPQEQEQSSYTLLAAEANPELEEAILHTPTDEEILASLHQEFAALSVQSYHAAGYLGAAITISALPAVLILLWAASEYHYGIPLGLTLWMHTKAPLIAFAPLCLTLGLSWRLWRVNNRRAQPAQKAAQMDDVRTLPLLIDALVSEDLRLRNRVKERLTVLLPKLKASDDALLSEAQKRRLNRFLTAWPDSRLFSDVREVFSPAAMRREADLQVAVLKAFEQVGDESVLPNVQKLANGDAKSRLQKQVRDAAADCLPYLEQRVNAEKQSQTLLRASDADDRTEHLLRAAHFAADNQSELLLRPGSKEA